MAARAINVVQLLVNLQHALRTYIDRTEPQNGGLRSCVRLKSEIGQPDRLDWRTVQI